jgi:hypothetical protein
MKKILIALVLCLIPAISFARSGGSFGGGFSSSRSVSTPSVSRSYSAPSYSRPSYSAPSYSKPSYSTPSRSYSYSYSKPTVVNKTYYQSNNSSSSGVGHMLFGYALARATEPHHYYHSSPVYVEHHEYVEDIPYERQPVNIYSDATVVQGYKADPGTGLGIGGAIIIVVLFIVGVAIAVVIFKNQNRW